ncbi:MAG: thioredoxin [Gammaproteobacteria bacterium]|nr:thioredoxin [Gammaproteobacteria bacterium]MBT3860988.1 thioredoxin [Gammaproteobacteria bacterium]MBT3986255.1 thioredoxin [Gammaproteobacteria bacterium]MBT4256074.1 thioredoxin [Gammaproteobacteria bacterium]MBT4582671.1 thioredoxin [Gammaproteobacteria bacterium]
MRDPYQESVILKQFDWQGNEVWSFDRLEQVVTEEIENEDGETEGGDTVWGARIHHDWQRQGNSVGYYAPDAEPQVDSGSTLILGHKNHVNLDVSDKRLEDDYIYEVNWDGEITWDWTASEHIDEMGFSEEARNSIYRSVGFNEARQSADWLHINSATYVGPNKWYDEGDERFHPDHIMISSRTASFIAIIARDGSIAWRMGPDYRTTPELAELGQIIGQHNPHIIQKGLPGAGNLLVFDNGGRSGYGFSNPARPDGTNSLTRDSSRVLEINPVTFEKIWEYSVGGGTEQFQFYSWYVSNAQRLPNGNTMVNEGMDGRVFELTPEKEIVWEYVSPFFSDDEVVTHRVYRAYRLPYEWIPQLVPPVEKAVIPPNLSTFRVPSQ